MTTAQKYLRFIAENHAQGSGTAQSYVTAIKKIEQALHEEGILPRELSLWEVSDTQYLEWLYELPGFVKNFRVSGVVAWLSSVKENSDHPSFSKVVDCDCERTTGESEKVEYTPAQLTLARAFHWQTMIDDEKFPNIKPESGNLFRQSTFSTTKRQCCFLKNLSRIHGYKTKLIEKFQLLTN